MNTDPPDNLDDELTLSASTAAALQEFYAERDRELADRAAVTEDWQLSQFWYDQPTARTLAEEAVKEAGPHGRIACISCPTCFGQIFDRKLSEMEAYLFEFDRRFEAAYGNLFVFYDYKESLNIPTDMLGTFDFVLLDPPFLSEKCVRGIAKTAKALAKTEAKFLICTGAQIQQVVIEVFGARICSFRPKHERNLANEFYCYVTYNSDLI